MTKPKQAPLVPSKKYIHLIAIKAFEKDCQESEYGLAIVAKESILSCFDSLELPSHKKSLLEEFFNIMPNELLWPTTYEDIQHAIDLVLGS